MLKEMLTASYGTQKEKWYRPDIDGLRGLAVIAVVANHFNSNIIPKGYLGVDIFFVISGFVVYMSIVRACRTPDRVTMLKGWILRRFKRIGPTLLVYTVVTSIVICMVNPMPGQALRTGIFGVWGMSNIYLASISQDYFSSSTELNPFAQTWSLGVEEQFYLLLAVLAMVAGLTAKKKNKEHKNAVIIGLLAILSVGFYICMNDSSKVASYYLLQTRFWELALGCMALIASKEIRLPAWIYTAESQTLILMIIGLAMYSPTSTQTMSTLAVTLMTAMLIGTTRTYSLAYRLLSRPSLRFAGKISYSLYLWHWGVICISRWTIGIHWWSIPFQAAMVGVISVLSYKYLEEPLRQQDWLGQGVGAIVKPGLLMVMASVFIMVLGKQLKENIFAGDRNSSHLSQIARFESKKGKCELGKGTRYEHVRKNCIYFVGKNFRTIWLAGDSHAGALGPAVEQLAKDFNMNLFMLDTAGTVFPATTTLNEGKAYGLGRLDSAADLQEASVAASRRSDIFVLAMRYSYHFKPIPEIHTTTTNRKNTNTTSHVEDQLNKWTKSMNKFAHKLKERGANMIIMRPMPESHSNANKLCRGVEDQWFNSLSREECGGLSSDQIQQQRAGNIRVDDAIDFVVGKNSNAYAFDSFEALCDQSSCKHTVGGNAIFADSNHLTVWGSRLLMYPLLKNTFILNGITESK